MVIMFISAEIHLPEIEEEEDDANENGGCLGIVLFYHMIS